MIKIKPRLTLENIHKLVSQEQIWMDLLNVNITKQFALRSNDTNPSCSLIPGRDGDVLLIDRGTSECYSWWKYLQVKEYGNNREGFFSALEEIRRRYNLDLTPYLKYQKDIRRKPIVNISRITRKEKGTKIGIKYQRKGDKLYYSQKVLDYWGQYGITKQKLIDKMVFPLSSFWINDNHIRLQNKLVFGYYHGKNMYGDNAFSIYIPDGMKMNDGTIRRWFKNIDRSIIQNLDNIDNQGELLIVQTSLKDIMCMECLGYSNIIAPNSEGTFFYENDWNSLKERFNHQIYFANNDWHKEVNPGLNYARKYKETYGLNYIHVPDNTTTDISDYRAKYGEKETIKLLEKLF